MTKMTKNSEQKEKEKQEDRSRGEEIRGK